MVAVILTNRLISGYTAALSHWNSVPSVQMQWSMMASFRATATLAFLCPIRFVSLLPQILSGDPPSYRLSPAWCPQASSLRSRPPHEGSPGEGSRSAPPPCAGASASLRNGRMAEELLTAEILNIDPMQCGHEPAVFLAPLPNHLEEHHGQCDINPSETSF